MLRVLHLTRAQIVRHSHRSTASLLALYPAARSACEFIKKNHPSISLPLPPPAAVPCGCSVLSVDVQSPRCCHTPHPSPLACPRRTRRCWWCSLRPSHAPPACHCQAQCWWHWWWWCSQASLLLDASGVCALPLATGSHPDGQN